MATHHKQSASLNLTHEQRGFEIMSVLMWFGLFWLSEGGCVRLLWRWVCGQKAHNGVLQRTERISNNASSLTRSLSRIAVSDYTGISFHFSRWRRRRHRSTLTVCRIIRLAVGGYTPARSLLHHLSPAHLILPHPYIFPTVPHFGSSVIKRVVGLLCTQHHCCARCRGLETQLNTV
jgi:hypothetical protein